MAKPEDWPGVAGVFFAVRHMAIDFLAAAIMDDLLEVHSTFEGCSGARLVIGQEVRRAGEAIVRARVTVVALGPNGRPRRIPAELAAALGPAGEGGRIKEMATNETLS